MLHGLIGVIGAVRLNLTGIAYAEIQAQPLAQDSGRIER